LEEPGAGVVVTADEPVLAGLGCGDAANGFPTDWTRSVGLEVRCGRRFGGWGHALHGYTFRDGDLVPPPTAVKVKLVDRLGFPNG